MNTPNQKDWEDYLQGESELSRLYRSADEPPPAALDRTILEAAHSSSGSRAGYGPFSGGWRRPVAVAAVMVICLTVVLIMENQVLDRKQLDGTDTDTGTRFSESELPATPEPPKALESPALRDSVDAPAPQLPEERVLQREAAPAREPAMGLRLEQPASELRAEPPPEAAGGEHAASSPAPALLKSIMPPETPRGDSAETWLVRIRILFERGHTDAAQSELEAFRQRYPDYPADKLEAALTPYLKAPAEPARQ